MKCSATDLPGVLLFELRRFRDDRGFFIEVHEEARYREHGVALPFVQDNFSRSCRGTLRGLHFQDPNPQGKLVSVLRGRVFDVAIDIRRGSPTFGRHVAVELSDDNGLQLYVPPGFAHGFLALSDEVDFFYKCTAPYYAKGDRVLRWSDPALGIRWPLDEIRMAPLLSPKDRDAPLLAEAEPTLPTFEG